MYHKNEANVGKYVIHGSYGTRRPVRNAFRDGCPPNRGQIFPKFQNRLLPTHITERLVSERGPYKYIYLLRFGVLGMFLGSSHTFSVSVALDVYSYVSNLCITFCVGITARVSRYHGPLYTSQFVPFWMKFAGVFVAFKVIQTEPTVMDRGKKR